MDLCRAQFLCSAYSTLVWKSRRIVEQYKTLAKTTPCAHVKHMCTFTVSRS